MYRVACGDEAHLPISGLKALGDRPCPLSDPLRYRRSTSRPPFVPPFGGRNSRNAPDARSAACTASNDTPHRLAGNRSCGDRETPP